MFFAPRASPRGVIRCEPSVIAACDCELAYTAEQYMTLDPEPGVADVVEAVMRMRLRRCVCGRTLACYVSSQGQLRHISERPVVT